MYKSIRWAPVATAAALLVCTATGLAATKTPQDGHYANHGKLKAGQNTSKYVDFDVVGGKVTAITHYDKCIAVPLKWPNNLAFKKGRFAFHARVVDFVGQTWDVTLNGTATSTTAIKGLLKARLTKPRAPRKSCSTTVPFKAKRTGPPAGVQ